MYTTVKRSGGPQTPEGKAASSKNAIKSGAYSRHAILPGEDESVFEELLSRLLDEYKPRGLLEESLVRDIAIHIWRKLRVERLEASYFLKSLYRQAESWELKKESLTSDFAPDRSEADTRRSIIDDRLYQFVLKHNTQRPIEDINRSLFKLMAELRRQQEWRLQKRATLIHQCLDSDEVALRAIAAADALNEIKAEAIERDR